MYLNDKQCKHENLQHYKDFDRVICKNCGQYWESELTSTHLCPPTLPPQEPYIPEHYNRYVFNLSK